MNNLQYNERTGEFEPNGTRRQNAGSSDHSALWLLGIIGVAILLWIMYSLGVFNNFIDNTKPKAPKEKVETLHLHGYIGEYPVTMQLTIDGSVIEGSYYYDRGSSTLILSGTYDDGDITLHETTSQGRPTGNFQGRLSGKKFKGKFVNSKGEKFSFNISVR